LAGVREWGQAFGTKNAGQKAGGKPEGLAPHRLTGQNRDNLDRPVRYD
jgi:hypothetical protein